MCARRTQGTARGLRGKSLTSPEESPLGFPLHGSVAKPTIKHTYSAADLWGRPLRLCELGRHRTPILLITRLCMADLRVCQEASRLYMAEDFAKKPYRGYENACF